MRFTFKGNQIGEVVSIRPAAQELDRIGRYVVNILGVELVMKQTDYDIITIPYVVTEDKNVQAILSDSTADIDYSQLTKVGLLEVANDLGIEISTRDSKATIIEAIKEAQAETTITAGGE